MRLLPYLAAMLLGMVVAFPPQARATTKKRALRLMTYNVNYGNPDPAATIAAIDKADVDVVLLQEITFEWKRVLERHFATKYPHSMYRVHTRAAGGLAVLSKLPIESEEVFPSPHRGWFPAERLVLTTEAGPLQILHVHLRPAIDGGSWIRGFMTTPPLRRREIETHWRNIAKDLPTIVAGDFNEDTSGQALGFLIRQGLSRVETSGPTTWHYEITSRGKTSDLIKLDIDHVMVDERLVASDGHVLDAGTSDHRPVIVTIEPRA